MIDYIISLIVIFVSCCLLILVSCWIHEVGHWIMLKLYGVRSRFIVRNYGLFWGVEILENKKGTTFKYLMTAISGGMFSAFVFYVVFLITDQFVFLYVAVLQFIYAIAETIYEFVRG